jgi:hypothetical protein
MLRTEIRGVAAAEPEAMNWPYLRRGDICGIIIMAVVLAAIVLVGLLFLRLGQQNFGFGPEWQCIRMEKATRSASSWSRRTRRPRSAGNRR